MSRTAIFDANGALLRVVFTSDLPIEDLEGLTTDDCPDEYPGALVWDEATQAWVAPPPPPPAPISSLDFINLFTLAEKLAAYASDAAAVRMTIGDAQAAGTIHLDDPRVADGLDLLESVGIIDAARIPEILAGTPPQ